MGFINQLKTGGHRPVGTKNSSYGGLTLDDQMTI
jgi:hypothetical protein